MNRQFVPVKIHDHASNKVSDKANTPHPFSKLSTTNPSGIPKSFLYTGVNAQSSSVLEEKGSQYMHSNKPVVPYWVNSGWKMAKSEIPGGQESEEVQEFIEPSWQLNPLQNEEPAIVIDDDSDKAQPLDEEQAQSDNESEASESGELLTAGQKKKRVSAFKRLGPVSKPKRPKLTINLLFSKETPVREVVDDAVSGDKDAHVPVFMRDDVVNSTNEVVVKFLPLWPWSKPLNKDKADILRTFDILLKRYTDNTWIKIVVTGYPPHYKKEDVLDLLYNKVTDKNFIPCFIEFTSRQCKFLVVRCLPALEQLYRCDLTVVGEEVRVGVAVYRSIVTLTHLDFIPRLVLRSRLAAAYDGEGALDLSQFCLQSDLSHFIYYPLNHVINQTELIQLQSVVHWDNLVKLDLSNNRLTSIRGLSLSWRTPRLHILNLSNNLLDKFGELLHCRGLLLRSLSLEGNPLCLDFIEADEYVKVTTMLFPTLRELDGVPLHRNGEMAPTRQHYAIAGAQPIAEKFLDVYFPLLDSSPVERHLMSKLYHKDAVLSITHRERLGNNPLYRYMGDLFCRSRDIRTGDTHCIEGADNISRHFAIWPAFQHDPHTFHLDVIYRTDSTTILRIDGVMKLIAESLAEDEPLVFFTRTVVLHSTDGVEYLIRNELIGWDLPTKEVANAAFTVTQLKPNRLTVKLESAPDEELRKNLIKIFMKITKAKKSYSERCLELKGWDLRLAIEYFAKVIQ